MPRRWSPRTAPRSLPATRCPTAARPIAQAYAGHQYGHFTVLGDGRAILLGEQITPTGDRLDVQLKGPGRTRFSRGGDGRAALGPMLREYIISEAMHALGIPSTRSLAVVTTGEPVYREEVLQGAVLTRVAASHIRVGTMQWAGVQEEQGAAQALADYTRARHYPEIAESTDAYLALFEAILARQAALIARWQLVGFIHGVMNTDNMALSGETIDYGPCAFMDAYDPATVFSSIDHAGRYAYKNQPAIAQWNLARLAEAMLPLFDPDPDRAIERATPALARFPELFQQHWLNGMRAKLGLFNHEEDDAALVNDLLTWMHRGSADFTNTFRALTAGRLRSEATARDADLEAWHRRLDARRARQSQPAAEAEALMRRHNPAVIPRNHKVEEALAAARFRRLRASWNGCSRCWRPRTTTIAICPRSAHLALSTGPTARSAVRSSHHCSFTMVEPCARSSMFEPPSCPRSSHSSWRRAARPKDPPAHSIRLPRLPVRPISQSRA